MAEDRRKLRKKFRGRVWAKAREYYASKGGKCSKEETEEYIKTDFAIIGMIAASILAQLAWYFIKKWLDAKLEPQDVPAEAWPEDEGEHGEG